MADFQQRRPSALVAVYFHDDALVGGIHRQDFVHRLAHPRRDVVLSVVHVVRPVFLDNQVGVHLSVVVRPWACNACPSDISSVPSFLLERRVAVREQASECRLGGSR